jgi:hypothetical protein
MRGRIRSLELRTAEAWEHFGRAAELAQAAPETIKNLIYKVVHELYRLENALLEEAPAPDLAVAALWLPRLPPEVMREYPEVQVAINLRRSGEALLRLHLGEAERAAEHFSALIAADRQAPEDVLVFYYLGLAAAAHNLGQARWAEVNLENASFAVRLGGRTLNRARAAAILRAFQAFLGNSDEAVAWEEFLGRLDCPESTKEVFRRRGARLVARCTETASLLIL